jgi:CDP-4-dehydro-6-deoxyglucose reductase, E3
MESKRKTIYSRVYSEPMPVPSYQLRCTANTKLANGIYEFHFEKPAEFTFKAGQFVLFDVALVDNPADIQTRALSIASAPDEPELIFVNKQKEGGRASTWIEKVLEPGVIVRTQGPFGNFRIDEMSEKPFLFIATSTGVAPFRSQMLDMLSKGNTKKMDLVFGVRSEEDLFWKTEFESIAQQYPNVFVHFPLSNPSNEWKGHKGRVQTLVPLIVPDITERQIYICGSPDMTKELKQLCLEEWHVEKKDLHVEGYI